MFHGKRASAAPTTPSRSLEVVNTAPGRLSREFVGPIPFNDGRGTSQAAKARQCQHRPNATTAQRAASTEWGRRPYRACRQGIFCIFYRHAWDEGVVTSTGHRSSTMIKPCAKRQARGVGGKLVGGWANPRCQPHDNPAHKPHLSSPHRRRPRLGLACLLACRLGGLTLRLLHLSHGPRHEHR